MDDCKRISGLKALCHEKKARRVKKQLHLSSSRILKMQFFLLATLFCHATLGYANSLTLSTPHTSPWVGLIGVDYQPNHYAIDNAFNYHDVFYVGNTPSGPSGAAITNTYAEIAQLKAAGFTAVRSYQTTDYSWIDIIHSASQLGMKVIYEAVIPQNGDDGSITAATSLLSTVINQVGVTVFNDTVILVLAGHENYCDTCGPGGGSNIAYLTNAVTSLQAVTTVPVGSALIAGNLVTPSPSITTDMTTLINSYSATAPMSFDPYPFQWGVQVANAVETISHTAAINSIGFDYYHTLQNFPSFSARPILMAESGWATAGTTNPGYACNSPGPCTPSVTNQVNYLTALYSFVNTPANNAGILVFEAYDEPAKVAGGTDMEDYYGVFDQDCQLKVSEAILPNPVASLSNQHGCQGFASGALLTIVGGFSHPYTVNIKQKNPVTGVDASISVNNPTGNAGPLPDAPFPAYLVFENASITIRGDSPTSCTSTVKSITHQKIEFSGNCSCPNNQQNTCFY